MREGEKERPRREVTTAFDVGAAEARRLAVAAQGFGRPRPSGKVDARHLRRAIDDVGLLQLDSVNVFCRSHYMPVFSRLGPYPREALDRLASHENGAGQARRPSRRDLIEYWGHEASLLPVELQPLLRWRMARADSLAWKGVARVAAEQPDLVEFVLEMVRERGPLRASELAAKGRRRAPGEMWSWSEEKTALEYLFFAGRVCAARRVNFERLYDLPERVLPRPLLEAPTPSQDEAQRRLLLIAAKRLGVATEPDLGDYFRLPRAESKARVAELAESGALVPVRVEGWRQPGYLSPERPKGLRRAASARALLTPFDSLVWARERTERIFGFRYRIEIYVPAPKRVYGYYVLPFLLGDRLVARVDLKSDRQAGLLRVRGAFAEPAVDLPLVAEQLADELRLLSDWLDLGGVAVARKGDLATPLRRALA
ncbi:MAG TPA: crosslink repair DNA glycosylase YcaQ family protein [Solirubrobacterales bacterium]|nr:crosslink repair DNA glycosylase YcaQ family protein [Solirubrobacterales bacterium]